MAVTDSYSRVACTKSEFIYKIQVLYSLSTVRIKVNSLLSDPVLISNGTCQSCLLSPILYILTIEHLASALRANDKTQGIELQGRQHKLSLFAGDLLLYASNPWVVFPSILKVLDHFGLLSNFKVNATKSQCFNVSSTADQKCPQNAFPFSGSWISNKYFEVQTTAHLHRLYDFIGIHPA